MKLDVETWQDFLMSALFDMKNGFFNNKPETVYQRNKTSIPFLGATAENNGITDYCDIESIKSSNRTGDNDDTLEGKIFEGNCITITNDGSVCYAYYQQNSFSCSHSMTICQPKFTLNMLRAMFICSIINNERYKWSYGRKLHDINKSKNIIIKLPIQHNPDGSPLIDNTFKYSKQGYVPDWQFMEDYIKSLHYKPITTKRISTSNIELNVSQWDEFKVDNIFEVLSGKGITKEELEENEGNFEAVQSGEENNGVIGKIDLEYCKSMDYVFTNQPCLTIARTGTAGFTSFHRNGCVVGDSAKILIVKKNATTTNQYLFLRTIFEADRFKYTYGRKVKTDKLKESILKLPIQHNSDGRPVIDKDKKYHSKGYVPDWQFMEDYINSLPYSDRI